MQNQKNTQSGVSNKPGFKPSETEIKKTGASKNMQDKNTSQQNQKTGGKNGQYASERDGNMSRSTGLDQQVEDRNPDLDQDFNGDLDSSEDRH